MEVYTYQELQQLCRYYNETVDKNNHIKCVGKENIYTKLNSLDYFSSNLFNILPDDILFDIFYKLDHKNMMKVCVTNPKLREKCESKILLTNKLIHRHVISDKDVPHIESKDLNWYYKYVDILDGNIPIDFECNVRDRLKITGLCSPMVNVRYSNKIQVERILIKSLDYL